MQTRLRQHTFFSAALIAALVLAGPGSAAASPRGPGKQRGGPMESGRARHDYIMHRGHPYNLRPDEIYHYNDIMVIRPYGHHYPGYGHYHNDDSAYQWLAFTAITLAILNELSETQQRAYEQAQIKASTAPVGESIIWNSGDANGSATAIRDGVSTSGRYCREFQQKVTIGGKTEQAYGTACLRPDGSWEVISTSDEP